MDMDTTTITQSMLDNAVAGEITGHCLECDTYTVLLEGFLCEECTEPTAEKYNNGLTKNKEYTGISVSHPTNERSILVTGDEYNGFEAWWSDGLTTLFRAPSEQRVIDWAKRRIRKPR